MDSLNIWDSILARVETKVNRHSYYTWFHPSSLLSDSKELVRVRVPNPVFRDWLTKHYAGIIAEALAEVGRAGARVEFVTEAPAGALPTAEEAAPPIPPEEAASSRLPQATACRVMRASTGTGRPRRARSGRRLPRTPRRASA